MMRINLLGSSAPAARVAAQPSASSRQAMIFVGALAVAMSVTGFLYYYWNSQVNQAQTALSHEQIRQKELAAVRAQNQLYQQQLKQLQERIDTIQKLQSSRTGPVDLMTALGDSVNRTQDLYLSQVSPAGNVLHIRGQAQTVEAIANFIKALKDSSQFSNVELRQYYQDDQHGRMTFKFNLDCTYAPPGTAEPAPDKAAARPGLAGAASQG
jgi:Tfp pilus assembly protein PilN